MQVQIRRREEISHLPTKVINESKIFLGSHYDGRQPLRGLSEELEKKYLPNLLGVSATHPDFSKKTRDFWAEMTILVPSSGVVLDITMDEESKEPYNLEDWIKYKWALKHKLVAENQSALENDPRKKFYIYNPDEETARKHQSIQKRKAADVEFIKATKDPAKAKRIVRMMDNILNPDAMSEAQVENRLFDLKNEKPDEFLRIAKDSNLDVKAEIQELVSYEILTMVGPQVIYIDQVIGQNLEEAVIWYKDKQNSSLVAQLKAKLSEYKNRR